jgi:hypothetical protein
LEFYKKHCIFTAPKLLGEIKNKILWKYLFSWLLCEYSGDLKAPELV